jgi:N-acetylmuramoyl-L-alanine amidase
MEERYIRWGFFALSVLMMCSATALGFCAQQIRYTVLIDPAHGGDDTGVFIEKIREKELTLNLALLIRQEAQKSGNFQVHLTRSTDMAMTLSERNQAINAIHPDCLLSLHMNAGFGNKASGYEVYFPGFRQTVSVGGDSSVILKDMQKNSYLNESVRLAQQVQAALEMIFPRKGRGLREAPYPLFDTLTLPGLVVEIGFVTQSEDRKKLTDQEKQKGLARAMVKGLQAYFQKVP